MGTRVPIYIIASLISRGTIASAFVLFEAGIQRFVFGKEVFQLSNVATYDNFTLIPFCLSETDW